MKRMIGIVTALLLALLTLAGCASSTPAAPETPPTPGITAAPEAVGPPAASEAPDAPTLPNPVVEVPNARAFFPLGVSIEAPWGASDASYAIIADRIAQVQFTLNGASYTLRAAQAKEENEDISGIYEEFEEEENAMSIDGEDWYAIIVVKTIKSGGYLASWQYEGSRFTLHTPDQPSAEEFNELATAMAESAYRAIFPAAPS